MRQALVDHGEPVDIGDTQLRFVAKGKAFQDDFGVHQALNTGIFMRARVTRGGKEMPGQWLFAGSSDDLETIVAPYIDEMTVMEISALAVALTARPALRIMNKSRPGADARPALSLDGTIEETGEIKDPGMLPSGAIFKDCAGQLFIASGGRFDWLSGQPFTPGQRPEFSHEAAVSFDLSEQRRNPDRRAGPVFFTSYRYEGDWDNVARYAALTQVSPPDGDTEAAVRPCSRA